MGNMVKKYKNVICSEIHEINNLGFLKNLCLRDSSFLKINEKSIYNEKKIVSPCGKKVLGRLLDVLGCELDECKEMDVFENPNVYELELNDKNVDDDSMVSTVVE